MLCAPYKAIVGLDKVEGCTAAGGVGQALLAPLDPGMRVHVLK